MSDCHLNTYFPIFSKRLRFITIILRLWFEIPFETRPWCLNIIQVRGAACMQHFYIWVRQNCHSRSKIHAPIIYRRCGYGYQNINDIGDMPNPENCGKLPVESRGRESGKQGWHRVGTRLTQSGNKVDTEWKQGWHSGNMVDTEWKQGWHRVETRLTQWKQVETRLVLTIMS